MKYILVSVILAEREISLTNRLQRKAIRSQYTVRDSQILSVKKTLKFLSFYGGGFVRYVSLTSYSFLCRNEWVSSRYVLKG